MRAREARGEGGQLRKTGDHLQLDFEVIRREPELVQRTSEVRDARAIFRRHRRRPFLPPRT